MAYLLTAFILFANLLSPVKGNDFFTQYVQRIESEAVEAMKLVWDIEEGQLTEDASIELLEDARAKMDLLPPGNEHLENLEVISEAAEAELTKPKMRLLGVWTVTNYCSCRQCSGIWYGCNTASGVPPTPYHTAAHNYLPFGTRIFVEGHEYVIEDRGDANMAGGDWIDLYVSDHNTAAIRGLRHEEVWIIDE